MLIQSPPGAMLAMEAAFIGRAHLKHQALTSMMLGSVEIDKMDYLWAKRVRCVVAKGARTISKVLALNKVVLTYCRDVCTPNDVHIIVDARRWVRRGGQL